MRSENGTVSYEQAAARYKPTQTTVLFIAESPPSSVDRYFYFEQVREMDSLWVELMKAIYSGDFGETSTERLRKAGWLKRFQSDGYQLIDSVKEPFQSGVSSTHRKKIICLQSKSLIGEVRAINPDQIVLITATVFEGLCCDLLSAGMSVVNTEHLPFPGSGQQRNFQNRFEKLLESGRLTLPRPHK